MNLSGVYRALWNIYDVQFCKNTFYSNALHLAALWNGYSSQDVTVKLSIQKQPPKVFYNKSFFKNFAISTGKHLSWSLFLIKTCNFIKKRLQHRCFSWISRNLQQHILWKTFANGCFRMLYIWSISSFLGITDASYQNYYFYNQSNKQPMMM